jgi:putative solute:sodium symporter small subunit
MIAGQPYAKLSSTAIFAGYGSRRGFSPGQPQETVTNHSIIRALRRSMRDITFRIQAGNLLSVSNLSVLTADNAGYPEISNRLLGEESGAARGEPPAAPIRSKKNGLRESIVQAPYQQGGVASMQLTQKHQEYWGKNLRITGILLFVWFFFTFVTGWFSRELNEFTFLGPLGFYFAAQGSLIIYVLIIGFYAKYMNKLDVEYGVHEGEDD